MTNSVSIERAQTYLDVQLNRTTESNRRAAGGPFITISRVAGSGGSLLAEELCRRLNRHRAEAPTHWTAFDRNLVEKLLEENKLSVRLARFLPEDKISEVQAAVGELVGLHPSLWTLIHKTNAMMRRLAILGHVIVVGRGANFTTAGVAHGFHVRTVGSPEHCARRTSLARKISVDEALVQNRLAQDAARKYVKSVFNAAIDDALAYDLVINTDRVSIEHAADLVMVALQDQGMIA